MDQLSRYLVVPIVALLVAGALAAAVVDPDDIPGFSAAPTTTTTVPTTTTTTVPPLFPPIVPGFEINTVRTNRGYLLPVLGGRPGAWLVRSPCGNDVEVSGVPVHGAHVVLDPGHGGADEPGAVGPVLRLVERDVNLAVALRVRDRLQAVGATVGMTRDRDVRVTLATRGEITRSLDPLVFVSIHHNAGSLSTSPTPAPEVYHQLADPDSQRLAGLLYEELVEHFAPFGTDWAVGDDPGARARRSIRTGDDFYGVLRNTQGVPAILSEPAYLSNPAEEALLATDAFVDAEATAIVDAITRFLATPDPGSGFRPVKEASAAAGGGGGSAGCVDPEL